VVVKDIIKSIRSSIHIKSLVYVQTYSQSRLIILGTIMFSLAPSPYTVVALMPNAFG
jgi:hypothetical protein